MVLASLSTWHVTLNRTQLAASGSKWLMAETSHGFVTVCLSQLYQLLEQTWEDCETHALMWGVNISGCRCPVLSCCETNFAQTLSHCCAAVSDCLSQSFHDVWVRHRIHTWYSLYSEVTWRDVSLKLSSLVLSVIMCMALCRRLRRCVSSIIHWKCTTCQQWVCFRHYRLHPGHECLFSVFPYHPMCGFYHKWATSSCCVTC